MNFNKIVPITLTFTLLFILFHQGVRAAVDLVSFTATAQEDSILIEWETATELENAGFYVTRDTQPVPPFQEISGFIPSEGSGVIGAVYQYEDTNVSSDIVYYYILEAVDTSQNVERHGPISATLTSQITLTPTSTSSKTPKTSTPTLTKTPTKTRTKTPSKTPTPVPPTLTPTIFTDTPTFTLTPSNTPSPTLLEAPEIVVVTQSTNTPVPTDFKTTPLPSLTPTPKGTLTQLVDSSYPMILSAICLVVLIWAAISVGLFIFLLRLNN
jgi:hypothetical protein